MGDGIRYVRDIGSTCPTVHGSTGSDVENSLLSIMVVVIFSAVVIIQKGSSRWGLCSIKGEGAGGFSGFQPFLPLPPLPRSNNSSI